MGRANAFAEQRHLFLVRLRVNQARRHRDPGKKSEMDERLYQVLRNQAP